MGEKTVLLVEDNPDDEALTLNAFDKGALPYLMVAMRGVAMPIGYCPMLNENVR